MTEFAADSFDDPKTYSEFGSGIVVCLAKFSQHLDLNMLRESIELYESIGREDGFSRAVEMWMNGASDHFYDLDEKAPPTLQKLARLALEIGHGFKDQTYTQATVDEIFQLWQEACMEVDKMLGVTADWGEW
jgi:hypothetical protein